MAPVRRRTELNLEETLNDFDPVVRRKALHEYINSGNIFISGRKDRVNLHMHSFYSYNSQGWSPTRIAWESHKSGFFASGIIDFDVLDGLSEFYEAGDVLQLRTSVGLETRSFFDDLADLEIDSPGEPGVSYIAGAGFTKIPARGTGEFTFLTMLQETARQRNMALIHRINNKLPQIDIDYEKDVLPATPSGNATERHIVAAYIKKAKSVFLHDKRLTFWSDVLGQSQHEIITLYANQPAFENQVRVKLAMRNGIGYEQPSSTTFPKTEKVFEWIKKCGAIPMESWLDGTSDGEKDPEAMLQLSLNKGALALNLIPERNWNITDPEERKLKIKNLDRIIQAAESFDMPLHIGTELNKPGQPLYDELDGMVLSKYKKLFMKGGCIVVGHVLLSRFADFDYAGEFAEDLFRNDISRKNAFFRSVGQMPLLSVDQIQKLSNSGSLKAFDLIKRSAKDGFWVFN